MKLPVIPGMDEFEGKAFHTARWDYEYTGGSQDDPRLTKLADKVVGVIGVGASGIQALPPLAESAKHVYVFQRTPSAIGERGNRPTDDDFAEQLRPGWQKERMENFSGGHDRASGRARSRRRRVDAAHGTAQQPRRRTEGMTGEDIAARVEAFDYDVMEEHRTTHRRDRRRSRPSRRCSSRTTATGASGPASTTSTCSRSTTPT